MAGASLLLVALAACGDQSGDPGTAGATPAPGTEAGEHPWLTADGELLVTCGGGPSFPAGRAAEGGLEVSPDVAEEIVATLADLKESGGIDAPGPLQHAEAEEVEWILLWQESFGGTQQAGVLLGDPGVTEMDLSTAEYASLEWQGESWQVGGWGGTCGARPALPVEDGWVSVALPDGTDPQNQSADQARSTAETATLDLMVSEIDCTSARDPEPYLAEPVVVETEQAVTVYWTTELPTGGADCPGNPWVPRSLTLQDPLGDRELLDGSSYPPTTVRTVTETEGQPPP